MNEYLRAEMLDTEVERRRSGSITLVFEVHSNNEESGNDNVARWSHSSTPVLSAVGSILSPFSYAKIQKTWSELYTPLSRSPTKTNAIFFEQSCQKRTKGFTVNQFKSYSFDKSKCGTKMPFEMVRNADLMTFCLVKPDGYIDEQIAHDMSWLTPDVPTQVKAQIWNRVAGYRVTQWVGDWGGT